MASYIFLPSQDKKIYLFELFKSLLNWVSQRKRIFHWFFSSHLHSEKGRKSLKHSLRLWSSKMDLMFFFLRDVCVFCESIYKWIYINARIWEQEMWHAQQFPFFSPFFYCECLMQCQTDWNKSNKNRAKDHMKIGSEITLRKVLKFKKIDFLLLIPLFCHFLKIQAWASR